MLRGIRGFDGKKEHFNVEIFEMKWTSKFEQPSNRFTLNWRNGGNCDGKSIELGF